MECPINFQYNRCSSREHSQTCETCIHYNQETTLQRLLVDYTNLLDLKNTDQKNSLKFIKTYISHRKKRDVKSYISESVWFICQAIDLHLKTLGKHHESSV